MSNLKDIQKQIIEMIQLHPIVICLRHQDPDPDAIGSQHGLARIIKNSFPEKRVYCFGQENPGLTWLGKEDQIKLTQDDYHRALVIVTDCPDQKRISNNLKNVDKIIKIDHHPLDDRFANLAWINPRRSSASEMIADLCFSSSDLKMDARAAYLLYAGIIGDTGRFMFPGVTSHTFSVVAQLAKYHIQMNQINQKETETTLSVSRFYGYLEQNLQVNKNGMAYYIVTNDLLKKFHLTHHDFISKNLPSNIKGVTAWLESEEQPDGTFKISLRSQGPAINKLAAKFNGGGHALASGAHVKNLGQVKAMIQQLNQIVQK